ncbi:MAG TPA: hypothetical protein PKL81_09230 [Ferruginibacter sp.]|nr:hypothetical protein [Ferruginibacter sp.]HNL65264.1 hypothetical protein [Ferruginibacter sp.]HNN70235.1 hypothetical protein [Ferruginibacter sp.]
MKLEDDSANFRIPELLAQEAKIGVALSKYSGIRNRLVMSVLFSGYLRKSKGYQVMPLSVEPRQIIGVFVPYFARGIGRGDAQVEVEPSVGCFIAVITMPPKCLSIFEGIELKTAFVAPLVRHRHHIADSSEIIALAFWFFALI